MRDKYAPCPIDTSEIDLAANLEGLIEQNARNVHEVCVQSRLEQVWAS